MRKEQSQLLARTIDEADTESIIAHIADNVLKWYDMADGASLHAGAEWYATALREARSIAEELGSTVDQVCVAIAVTSPRCSWETNLVRARAGLIDPMGASGLFGWQRERLAAIAEDDTASVYQLARGPKVSRFAQNIRLAGRSDAVTVDIWALRVAFDDPTLGDQDYKDLVGTPTKYEVIERGYQRATSILGHTAPSTLQAIVWVTMRDQDTTPANEEE